MEVYCIHTVISLKASDTSFLCCRRQPETAVYGVTRPGYDHCDITEGVLLDITPLLVDGRKVVTLYDKDLTEGINLLIGKYQPTLYYLCRGMFVTIFTPPYII